MQQFSSTDLPAAKVVFHKKIEDLQGGVTVSAADFVADHVVPAGTIIGKDSNGLFHAIKVAKLYTAATNSDTTYSVYKGHGFKVGDFVAALTGNKAYAITVINTSNATHDVITLSATLGTVVAQYAGLFQALAEAASNTSAFVATPFAVTGQDLAIVAGDSNMTDAYIRATLFEVNAPIATAQLKAALPQILWI